MDKKNKNDPMRMSDLAKKAGLPRSTVKFYVEQGLLPYKSKTAGGYRLFNERGGLKRLAEITNLQETKRLTIGEIKKHFRK